LPSMCRLVAFNSKVAIYKSSILVNKYILKHILRKNGTFEAKYIFSGGNGTAVR
jgi:hypothetical protein